VIDRPGREVGLGQAEALLDVPELAKQTRKSADRHGNAFSVTQLGSTFLDAGSWRANRLIVARYGDDESLEKAYDYGE
jgi:hypothetical protein